VAKNLRKKNEKDLFRLTVLEISVQLAPFLWAWGEAEYHGGQGKTEQCCSPHGIHGEEGYGELRDKIYPLRAHLQWSTSFNQAHLMDHSVWTHKWVNSLMMKLAPSWCNQFSIVSPAGDQTFYVWTFWGALHIQINQLASHSLAENTLAFPNPLALQLLVAKWDSTTRGKFPY
jgi:hypothetical protein